MFFPTFLLILFLLCETIFADILLRNYSFSLHQDTQINFPLIEKQSFYYLEESNISGLTPASFCKIQQQPSYKAKYYNGIHDQTDEAILLNQNHILSADNMLYVLSVDGILRAYNMSFQDDIDFFSDVVQFNHLNEILLKDDNLLLQELSNRNYVKLLYSEKKHMLIIISKLIAYAMSLDFDMKRTWMKAIRLNISETAPIIRADIIDDNLYILRQNNSLEVWNYANLNHIFKVAKYDLKFEMDHLNLTGKINVTDFDVNNHYLAIIEKNSKTLFIFDDDFLSDDFSSNLVHTYNFQKEPVLLFLFVNKMIILFEDGSQNLNSLEEYELFENKSIRFIRSTNFSGNLKDIVIGEIYVIIAFENHVEVFPHFFIDPIEANQILKFNDYAANITDIEYFQMVGESTKNESEFFTVMKDGKITILKIEELPGIMNCAPSTSTLPGIYYVDVIFYEINCPTLNQYCNSSEVLKKHQILQINVEKMLVESGNLIIIIALVIGLILGIIVAVFFCMFYVKSIRNKYEELKSNQYKLNLHRKELTQEELIIHNKEKE